MRTFIAIDLNEAIRARIAEQLGRLTKLAPHARWVRPDRLHLTLAFLGEIGEPTVPALNDAMARTARRHRPLTFDVRGGGVFGSLHHPKVLWVALTGDLEPLGALQADLTRELAAQGHLPEYETYEPHITIARSRNPRGDPSLSGCPDALRGVELGQLNARELVLFSSHSQSDGMNHVAISRHALG